MRGLSVRLTPNNKRKEDNMERPTKDRYYLGIALEVSKRSTCMRRQYGAVIVKNDEIIATGYNGAPRGYRNCSDQGFCLRDKLNCEKGSGYEFCPAVHAEQNAMLSASRNEMMGSTIYINGTEANGKQANSYPCNICARMICNSGIERVVCLDTNGEIVSVSPADLRFIK